MAIFGSRFLAVLVCAVLAAPIAALAQSSNAEQKPPDQPKGQAAGEAAKIDLMQKNIAEIAEAGRVLTGPAANPECVWLGRRVVRLLSQDDLDTAFRHLDIYDRFGCPGNHVQATFRCLLKVGIPDARTAGPNGLDPRVHACWLDPAMTSTAAAPPAAAAPTAAAPAAAPAGGTTTR